MFVHQNQLEVLVKDADATGEIVHKCLQQRGLFNQRGFALLVDGDIGVAGDKTHGAPIHLHGAPFHQMGSRIGLCALEPMGLEFKCGRASFCHLFHRIARAVFTAQRRVHEQFFERDVQVDALGRKIKHVEHVRVPTLESKLFVEHRDPLGQMVYDAVQVQRLLAQGRLGALVVGDVGIDADEAPIGQWCTHDFKHLPVGQCALKAVCLAFSCQCHAFFGLLVRVTDAVVATPGVEKR